MVGDGVAVLAVLAPLFHCENKFNRVFYIIRSQAGHKHRKFEKNKLRNWFNFFIGMINVKIMT